MDVAERFLEEFVRVKSFKCMQKLTSTAQGECAIMYFLSKHDGPASAGEISTNLGVSTARVAVALKSLAKKGYISTFADSRDRRRTLAQLTQEGARDAQIKREKLLAIIRNVHRKLGDEDSEKALELMAKIMSILEEGGIYEQLP